MRKVLVLGAGRIARPCIQYLLVNCRYEVFVSDICEKNIDRCIARHPNGHKIVGDSIANLKDTIKQVSPEVLICLLPATLIGKVTRACVDSCVHFISPSYLKPEVRELEAEAKNNGVTLLCELGLDPGIDHMSASRTIRAIHAQNGRILSFKSWCGALPAPKYNNNPIGYKLSWAPTSLIRASRREAKIIRNGRTIVWPDGETYNHASLIDIQGMGWFEEYANADSTPYVQYYGIPEAKDVYRGTIRNIGWCEMICKMQNLGLIDEGEHDFSGRTYADVTRELIGAEKETNLKDALCAFLDLEPYSAVILKLEWLGLFEERLVPINRGTMFQFVECLYNEKLVFAEEEQDVSIMEHRYLIEYSDRKVLKRSTLVDYGIPGSDFSVARLTGLPPAMGAKLILDKKIKQSGILTPTMPEVYEPELTALEKMGITFKETETLVE